MALLTETGSFLLSVLLSSVQADETPIFYYIMTNVRVTNQCSSEVYDKSDA